MPCTWVSPCSAGGSRPSAPATRRAVLPHALAVVLAGERAVEAAQGPSDTPPRRVKKPWRRPGSAPSAGVARYSASVMRLETRRGGQGGMAQAERLEQAGPSVPARSAARRRTATGRRSRRPAAMAVRASMAARADRPRRCRNTPSAAAHARRRRRRGRRRPGREMDMRGKVGRPGVGQRVGGRAVAHGLQAVAGPAAAGP